MEPSSKVQIICILGAMIMLATVAADEIDVDGSGEISDDESDYPDCIEEWDDCSTSDKPCYQRRTIPGGLSFPAEVLSFKFGDGVCKFREHIQNVEEYIRLSRQLYRTNFQALSTQYWRTVIG